MKNWKESQFSWEKTVNRSQCLDDTEFKAAILKYYNMNKDKTSQKRNVRYKEELKGDFRMEKHYN